jgi:hypothetical protein
VHETGDEAVIAERDLAARVRAPDEARVLADRDPRERVALPQRAAVAKAAAGQPRTPVARVFVEPLTLFALWLLLEAR